MESNQTNQRKVVNVFVAFPKGYLEDSQKEVMDQVRDSLIKLDPRFSTVTLNLVSSHEEYKKSFNHAGSWDSWANHIGLGVHPTTRDPLYHVFVASTTYLGKATAMIFEKAILFKKPVFAFAEGSVVRMGAVLCNDPNDYTAGWQLV